MKRPTIDDLLVIGGPDLANTIIQNRREIPWDKSVFKLLFSGQVSYCAFLWCRRFLSAAWRLIVRFARITRRKPNETEQKQRQGHADG
jgi:hypothetical protein